MTEQTTTTAHAAAMAAGLRQLAADLEAGKLPAPFDVSAVSFWKLADGRLGDDKLTPDDARDAMTAAPGGWSKEYLANYVTYRKDYGGSVRYDISLNREAVCRRVQVGVKEVPATEARTEPVFEWVCGDDDGADEIADAAALARIESSPCNS